MLVSVSHVSKTFGPHAVLQDVSFVLNPGEQAGLVGANGSGKTTLLRIIAGELEADAGSVAILAGSEAGYLPQQPPDLDEGATIDDLIYDAIGDLRQIEDRLRELEQVMACDDADLDAILSEYGVLQERFDRRGGYDLDHRIDAVLAGLDLANLPRSRRFASLSGGEAERVLLATLLLQSPDILLLDEPTNHLDFASIEWLGNFLSEYGGGVLTVSHDRHFLNNTVTRIFEIDEHSLELAEYHGDYDAYREAKDRERVEWAERYVSQQREMRELRRLIRVRAASVNEKVPAPRDPAKTLYDAKKATAENSAGRDIRWFKERLRRLENDPIPKPPSEMRINPKFDADELRSDEIIRLEGVSKAFDSTMVLGGIDFTLRRGDRAVIVGTNGSGKTTLLNLISGQLNPDDGAVRIAPAARIGFLDQNMDALDPDRTVFDVYRDRLVEYDHYLISDLITHGLFTIDDLEKRVGELSLGQRRKLQIARLIAEEVNVLVLDEPTNYLSLDVLEEFERALRDFTGPILVVSHDRWFIERFNGRIWELRDGKLTQHFDDPKRVVAGLQP